jgi:hypothetical protein
MKTKGEESTKGKGGKGDIKNAVGRPVKGSATDIKNQIVKKQKESEETKARSEATKFFVPKGIHVHTAN